MVLMTLLVAYHHSRSTTPSKRWRVVDGACSSKFRVHARKNSLPRTDCFWPVDYRIRANPVRPISFRHLAGSDRVGYLACRRPSNFRDFTGSKFSGHNLRSLVLTDQKPFLSLTGRVPLTNGSIPPESTVRASKGQALQLAHGLDFLSIQAYRLWMEYPSREKDERYCEVAARSWGSALCNRRGLGRPSVEDGRVVAQSAARCGDQTIAKLLSNRRHHSFLLSVRGGIWPNGRDGAARPNKEG